MKMRGMFLSAAVTIVVMLGVAFDAAALNVESKTVKVAPTLDGTGFDPAWQVVKPIMVDDYSGAKIMLSSVHTEEWVYFLVQYPDPAKNILHKPWVWDKQSQTYETGPHREDTFVFKWNMLDRAVDLSNYSADDYRADVWYWKANRTNPAGYADDKSHVLGSDPAEKATETVGRSGQKRYLRRISDAGRAPYAEYQPSGYEEDVVDRYRPAEPEGSRADVRAKGTWNAGMWTIEFARRLDSGHPDDARFDPGRDEPYQFGISIFSLYGRPHDPNSPNYYGRGRISKPLYLTFK